MLSTANTRDMDQLIDIRAQAITIHAPTSSYSLVFKHLRGAILDNASAEPTYVCGCKEYSAEEVILLLTESVEPLPPSMLKGHTFATAAYVFDTPDCRGSYLVGVALRSTSKGKINNESIRRVAMTDAIASLPTVDRTYFHLTLSLMEGRDIVPIVQSALAKKVGPHRQLLLDHLGSAIVAALVSRTVHTH